MTSRCPSSPASWQRQRCSRPIPADRKSARICRRSTISRRIIGPVSRSHRFSIGRFCEKSKRNAIACGRISDGFASVTSCKLAHRSMRSSKPACRDCARPRRGAKTRRPRSGRWSRIYGRQDSITRNQEPDRRARISPRCASSFPRWPPADVAEVILDLAGKRAGHHFPHSAARRWRPMFSSISTCRGAATTAPRHGARTGRRDPQRDVAGRSHGVARGAAERGGATTDPPAHAGRTTHRASLCSVIRKAASGV